jgi:hypothetical protein
MEPSVFTDESYLNPSENREAIMNGRAAELGATTIEQLD